ncbi:MAG: radical SAM protein [Nanoarchaeota archaeon]|nr:radical SAM protein [Nanoarchaeota archaeon]
MKHNYVLDGTKLPYHLDRVKAWLEGERIAPITIDWSLTRACTYKCIYCYGQLQENPREKITEKAAFDFLDDAAEIGVKATSIVSDGESTCSPILYDVIKHGKELGLDMALGTNGYLLKDKRLHDILPCLTYLRFNISAGEPDRYAYIHGVPKSYFHKVYNTMKRCVKIKEEQGLDVTIGLQMVLMPDFEDQIIPLAKLGKDIGVDYTIIKHCTDNELGSLGIDYKKYFDMEPTLKEAESYSTDKYLFKVKWHKILSGGIHRYTRCYGPPFMVQMSGSGLLAPCGSLFPVRHKRFHIGNIVKTRFKEMWESDKYWEIMDYLASDKFNARTDCGHLCLQHYINEFLWDLKKGNIKLEDCKPKETPPMHLNFI